MSSRIVADLAYPEYSGLGGNYSNLDKTLTGKSFKVSSDLIIDNCTIVLASAFGDATLTFSSDVSITTGGSDSVLAFGTIHGS